MDDITDNLKHKGIPGYKDSATKKLNFDWRFHFNVNLQTRTGVTTPLSHRVAERFELLLGNGN